MQSEDISGILNRLQIRPTDEIKDPPVIMCIANHETHNAIPLFTLGNFSLLIGKAKSRKTFLLTSIISAAISGRSGIDGLKTNLSGNDLVVHVDTEQAPFHVKRTLDRICRQAGIKDPKNLSVYGLRSLAPGGRLNAIKYLIESKKNLKLLVVDGLKDLLESGINDEKEAIGLISKILQWTFSHDIHILFVLHQNKNDLNARGHIGTEAVNKAELVLSVQRHQKDKQISVVTPEFCRDIEFEPFTFIISEEGLPLSTQYTPKDEQKQSKIEEILRNIFINAKEMKTMDLIANYMSHARVSESTAYRHLNLSVANGLVKKLNNGVYSLTNININGAEDPF